MATNSPCPIWILLKKVVCLSPQYPGISTTQNFYPKIQRLSLIHILLEGATIDGDLLGYPLWTNTQLLIYRTDMFEDADNMAAFEAEYGLSLIHI